MTGEAAPTTRLAGARHAAGMTQHQLARRMGVPRPNIARWESGSQLPTVQNALKLASLLNTSVEKLWSLAPNWEQKVQRQAMQAARVRLAEQARQALVAGHGSSSRETEHESWIPEQANTASKT